MSLDSVIQAVLPASLYRRLRASDIAGRFIRGSFWSSVNALVMKSATLLQALVLARVLGISGFGEWGIVLSTIAMLGVFASFGSGMTTTKHVAEWHLNEPERLGRLLGAVQIIAVSLGIAVALPFALWSNEIAAQLLAAPQLSGVLPLVGLIVLMNAVASVYLGILDGLEQFRDSALVQASSTVAGVSLTVLLAISSGVPGAALGLVLASALSVVFAACSASRNLRRRGIHARFSGSLSEWTSIRDYAAPTAIAGAIAMLAIWAGQVALARQPNGYDEMGAYQAANQWRTVITILPMQLLTAYLPVLSSLTAHSRERALRLQFQALRVSVIAALSLAVPIAALSPWLMRLYGLEFQPFWSILVLLALIPVFDLAHVVLMKSAVANGYAWTQPLANSAMLASTVLGIVWLIPRYLGFGLALTMFVAYASRVVVEYVIFFLRTRSRCM